MAELTYRGLICVEDFSSDRPRTNTMTECFCKASGESKHEVGLGVSTVLEERPGATHSVDASLIISEFVQGRTQVRRVDVIFGVGLLCLSSIVSFFLTSWKR